VYSFSFTIYTREVIMPISTIGDRRKQTLDKLLELRAYTATPLAATTSTPGLELDLTSQMAYEVICGVGAYTDYDAGVDQWSLSVSVSDDNSTWVVFSNVAVLTGEAKEHRFALTGAAVQDVVPGATHIRVDATETGAPGALTFGAYVSPV
jgi:hypothetical protein